LVGTDRAMRWDLKGQQGDDSSSDGFDQTAIRWDCMVAEDLATLAILLVVNFQAYQIWICTVGLECNGNGLGQFLCQFALLSFWRSGHLGAESGVCCKHC